MDITLSGRPGSRKFSVGAKSKSGFQVTKEFDITVLEDGSGNLASYFGNTAASSSNENESSVFEPSNVMDGDSSTRWSSAPTDTAWLVIDLQKTYKVSRVVLAWEASFATRCQILDSENARDWKVLHTRSGGDGRTDELRFHSTPVRFVKILATERAKKKWGYSLYEVSVFKE